MRVAEVERARSDDGVVIVVVALLMVAMLTMVAIVIDLNAGRNDRQSERLVADAASTAAALEMITTNAVNGCEAAKGYVVDNVPSISSLSAIGCSTFSGVCSTTMSPRTQSQTIGDYTVTLVHPVTDGHRFMDTATIGMGEQAVVDADEGACDRVGVELAIDRATSFGRIVGQDRLPTRVHSVAIAGEPTGENRPINLLILERRDCLAAEVSGGGSSGGIIVEEVHDPGPDGITGTADDIVHPGLFAVDSDGTGAGCSSNGTLHGGGTSATLRADGPPNCSTELAAGTGQGCGRIELFAPGTPGCNMPACSRNGSPTIAPSPSRLPERLTRAPIDHQFDCLADYSSKVWNAWQPIDPCKKAGTRPAYISDLASFVGSTGVPSGFTRYETLPTVLAQASNPCSVGNNDVVVVPRGNYYVGCSSLNVQGNLTFQGGNLVFQGNVSLGTHGRLTLNECALANSCGSTLSWAPDSDFVETQYSNGAAWMYFRTGSLTKGGQAGFAAHEMMGYFSSTSTMSLGGGGTGVLRWTAPTEGPFKNLGLWSESTLAHSFGGQGNLTLEGVFFVPNATLSYQGNGAGQSVAAQFLVRKLATGGNGALAVQPVMGRLVEFPTAPRSELIR